MRSLVIAVAQPRVVPLDIAANATVHAAAVRAAASRVVVFPELSLTGYELEAPLLDLDDPRLAPLVEACAATDTVALVGAPVDGPHIAMLAIDGDGARIAYRKQYPHGTQEARFLPGPGPEVLEVDGWRLGLAICRDTGIPEQVAAVAELGIDAYVAGIADEVTADEVMAERARRIGTEHGLWVAFASFAGPTGAWDETAGRSGIWTPGGLVEARAGRSAGEIARATMYAEDLALLG